MSANQSETRIYGFTIPAGGAFPLPVQGDNFRVLSTSGPVSVRWPRGFLANIKAGQGQEVPEGFSRLDLTNSGSGTVYGEILISDENFIDERITGEVSVIDGEKSRTLAGGRFMRQIEAVLAAEYPCTQIWNPVASGANLIVTGVAASLSAAGSVILYGDSLQLSNDVTGVGLGNSFVGNTAQGVAELRRETNPAPAGQPFGRLSVALVPADGYVNVPLNGPIVVPPGFGLSLLGQGAGNYLSTTFQWFEEVA